MTEMQRKLLNMFSWYHEICKKNKLVYFSIGGTLLGAVRHQGFIPWDDDIDVGMPRQDYERFIQLAESINSDSKYRIEFSTGKKEFVYPYCKIYDTETTLIENTRYQTKRGIYIDVFPIDGIGNTLKESMVHFKEIDRKVNSLCVRVCAVRKERKLYKNIAILVSRCIPEAVWNSQRIIKKIDILSKKKSYTESVYVANLVGNWHEKEIMKKEWFGKPVLYPFETIEIYGPENYDSYLKQVYGNYMQLPPVEKQISHHDYIELDLEHSYLSENKTLGK